MIISARKLSANDMRPADCNHRNGNHTLFSESGNCR